MKRLLATSLLLLLIFLSYIPLVFSLDTYTLIITVVDDKDNPLSGAWVKVTTKYGEDDYRSPFPKQTNASGVVEFTVQSIETLANVTVGWRGIEVASGDFTLTSGTTYINITCEAIASLTISATDSNSQPLPNAFVELNWEPWTLSQTADNQGKAVFQQMSFYTYQVRVKWQSLLVHQDTFNFSETARSYTAECNVHNLTVNVFDRENRPLSQAKVTLTRSDEWKISKYTEQGIAVFPQLAGADYTVQAFYGTYSNTTATTLSGSQELSLKLDFLATISFNVAVKAVWSDGKPVTTANVNIQNSDGAILFSGITNSSGITATQLTEGIYMVTVSKGNLTRTETANVTGEATVTVTFETTKRISTLIVEVYDGDQTPAYGAIVELYQNGQRLHNATAINGIATFSLPDGTYTIIAEFQDKRQEKTMEISEDTTLPIVFQTQFNLTPIIWLLVAVAMVIVIFAIIHLRKKLKPFHPFPTTSP